jgi:hypothetical protein
VAKRQNGLAIGSICCLTAVLVYFALPNRDSSDSYSIIRSQISKTPNARVLEVAPDLEPRYFPWTNQIPVAMVSADPAQDDQRFMRAASIGQSELSKYLIEQRITHLLVAPLNGERNHLFYRWSNTPSVNIRLTEPFFREVARAYGDYPASLFEVVPMDTSDFCSECGGAEFIWSGIRETAIDTSRFGYIDGPDILWILGQDQPNLKIQTEDANENGFRITFGLVAAYGGNAPPQILRFQSERGMKVVRLFPGPEVLVSVDLSEGETLLIDPVLPCVIPAVAQLDSGNQDLREMCFGITSVKAVEIP